MKYLTPFFLLMTIGFYGCGHAPEMPDTSLKVPRLDALEARDQKNFDALPLNGLVVINERLWSEGSWKLNEKSINLMWNALPAEVVSEAPTQEEIINLTPEDIAKLSPAVKFDLLRGNYTYPLRAEVEKTLNDTATDWEDLTNGWAIASYQHNEPKPKTLTNPDGIVIPFGSSDIKALLTYYYGNVAELKGKQMGRDCKLSPWTDWNQNCRDSLNAGVFHITLANKVGLRNESFIVDIEPEQSVRNHPVVSYSSKVDEMVKPARDVVFGTSKVLKVSTTVSFIDQTQTHAWEPVRGSSRQKVLKKYYSYLLYLSANGEIIGGKWLGDEAPDFLFTTTKSSDFKSMEALKDLVND